MRKGTVLANDGLVRKGTDLLAPGARCVPALISWVTSRTVPLLIFRLGDRR
jgi:hypothetical protein